MSKELNTCDKCHSVVSTYDLIWLTADDFEPLPDETLTDEAKKYDAVCQNCYGDIIVTH